MWVFFNQRFLHLNTTLHILKYSKYVSYWLLFDQAKDFYSFSSSSASHKTPVVILVHMHGRKWSQRLITDKIPRHNIRTPGMDVVPQVWDMDVIPQVWGMDVIPQVLGMDVIPQVWGMDVIPQVWGIDIILQVWGMDLVSDNFSPLNLYSHRKFRKYFHWWKYSIRFLYLLNVYTNFEGFVFTIWRRKC